MRAVSDYTTDDYERVGCSVVIETHPKHVIMKVYAPDGRNRPPVEVYGARSPDAIALALFDWLSGRAPRRNYANHSLQGLIS